ncbi:MAG: T9SS type A sorting domain-containing protein [Ignavibacteria bacterium]|nr:T9SS type A sorting domain-containing protein [Ignavibacteria bacterium]
MKIAILFLLILMIHSKVSLSQSSPVLLPGFPVILDSIDFTYNDGPIIADFDSDGRNEIFVGVNTFSLIGKVFLMTENGVHKNGFPKTVSCVSSYINIAAGDIDLDGKLDLVAKTDSLYVFDQFGINVTGFPIYIPLQSNTLLDKIALYDLDSDGRTEILLGRGNMLYVVNSNGKVRTGWPVNFNQGGTTFLSYLSVGDLNNDGMAEIVIPSSNNITTPNLDSSKIYILQEDGSNYPSTPIISDSGYYFDFWNYAIIHREVGNNVFSVLSNVPKFGMPGFNNFKTRFRTYSSSGSLLLNRTYINYYRNESMTLGKLDNNESYFLFGDFFFTNAISFNGNMFQGYPVFIEGAQLRNHNTGMVFGVPSFVSTETQDTIGGNGLRGYVKIHSTITGKQIVEDMRPLGIPGTAPNLTDLNKDGQLDVIVTTNGVINGGDGCAIYAWTIPGVPYKREDFPWPMWGHDRYRTNQYGFIPPDEPVGIQPASTEVPDEYELYQNYPNPFNPSTTIRFDVRTAGNVLLKVFDVLGREVEVIVNEYLKLGSYSVQFSGDNLPSGVYYYELRSESFSETKRMMLIK